jgi:hypothetical protein
MASPLLPCPACSAPSPTRRCPACGHERPALPKGGPRAGAGGRREAPDGTVLQGRKKLPRLTPEETQAAVAALQGTGTRAEFAARLGVSPQAIREVCAKGATVAQMEDWRGRLR